MRAFLFALLIAIMPLSVMRAQDALVVLPGTDVIFGANTIVSVDDLTITPDTDFIPDGFSLNRFATIQHPSFNVAISRVYRFSTPIENFSGSIGIQYEESELNGLLESGLQLNIHDGSAWHAYENNTHDEDANIVHTASLVNVSLNEITLADFASPLPLRWGPVTATRVKRSVLVAWTAYEQADLSHFDVERSLDSRHWAPVKTAIPAIDVPSQQYLVTDEDYHSGQLFYRIKGTDRDGRYYYSPVRAVGAENIAGRFILYPNPVRNSFSLTGDDPGNIQEIQLFTAGGVLLRVWKGARAQYDLTALPAGAYHVRVLKKDNTLQLIRITKP